MDYHANHQRYHSCFSRIVSHSSSSSSSIAILHVVWAWCARGTPQAYLRSFFCSCAARSVCWLRPTGRWPGVARMLAKSIGRSRFAMTAMIGTRMWLILSWGATLSQDPRLLETCCSLYERERRFALWFCLVLPSFFVACLLTVSPSFTPYLVLEAYDHFIVVTCPARPIHRHCHVLHL